MDASADGIANGWNGNGLCFQTMRTFSPYVL